MPSVRVTTIEIDLHPGEAFPPGLGAFLDQVTAPTAPKSADPILRAAEKIRDSAKVVMETTTAGSPAMSVRMESDPPSPAPVPPAPRAAPKKEPKPSKATPVMQAKRAGKDDPRRAKAKTLWQQRGLAVAEIGLELGLEPSTLYYWKTADDWGEKGARTK